VYILLVGNKSDLRDERRISEEEARDFAVQYHLDDLEISAKTGHNLMEAFIQLAPAVLTRINSGSIDTPAPTAKTTVPIKHEEVTVKSKSKSTSDTHSGESNQIIESNDRRSALLVSIF
jgi:GTPase SAR1 family protein